MRVSKAALQLLTDRLNKVLNRPETAYRKVNGKYERTSTGLIPNPGHIILDHASCYGGYRLDEMTEQGGDTFFTLSYRISAKEMKLHLDGLLQGIELRSGANE